MKTIILALAATILSFRSVSAQETPIDHKNYTPPPTQYWTNYTHSGQARLSNDLIVLNKTSEVKQKQKPNANNRYDENFKMTCVLDYKPLNDPIKGKSTPSEVNFRLLLQDKVRGTMLRRNNVEGLTNSDKESLIARGTLKIEMARKVEDQYKVIGYHIEVVEKVEVKPEIAVRYGAISKKKPLATLGPKYIGPKPPTIPANWNDETEFEEDIGPVMLRKKERMKVY